MTQAKFCTGTIYTTSSPVLMARMVDYYSQILLPSQVRSIAYTIYLLDMATGFPQKNYIPGQINQTVNVNNTFFATLQKNDSWTADTQGYNFRHVLDNANRRVFSLMNRHYQVEYLFQMRDNSPPICAIFRLFTL